MTKVVFNAENCETTETFSGCTSLSNITIGENVKTIPPSAFHSCRGLTSVEIPNSVTSIGDYAFIHCTGLTRVTIPNSVTDIGEYAFYSSGSDLVEFICENLTPPTAYISTFMFVSPTATLYVPTGSRKAYTSATGWSWFTNIVEKEMSGVEYVLCDSNVAVSVESGNIIVNGATDNLNVEVYGVNGQNIYCGNATTIPIAVEGLYIVKVNGKSFKAII